MCGERGEERGDAPKELGGMTRSVATSKQARKQARKQSRKHASAMPTRGISWPKETTDGATHH